MSDPTRAFWVWRHEHPRLAEGVSQDAFADIYRMGGGAALRTSSELAGLLPKLREVIWWIEAGDGDERDVERHEEEYAR